MKKAKKRVEVVVLDNIMTATFDIPGLVGHVRVDHSTFGKGRHSKAQFDQLAGALMQMSYAYAQSRNVPPIEEPPLPKARKPKSRKPPLR